MRFAPRLIFLSFWKIPTSRLKKTCPIGVKLQQLDRPVANIKANPRVSYSIADPYHSSEDFFGASGMQVWGRAAIFKRNDDPEKFMQILRHSCDLQGLQKQGLGEAAMTRNFNIITIEPDKIRRLSYRAGYRNVLWEKGKDLFNDC